MTIETACGGFALQQFDSDRKLLNVGVIDCAIALKHRPIWVTSARQRGTAWHQSQWRLLSSVGPNPRAIVKVWKAVSTSIVRGRSTSVLSDRSGRHALGPSLHRRPSGGGYQPPPGIPSRP